MESVHIGLGSNLGNMERNLKEAVDRLGAIDATRLLRISSLYFCEPIGGPPQPWYYNAIVQVITSLAPLNILRALQEIEKDMGRTRSERNSPRTIDLDIIFFGEQLINTDDLIIPHPRLLERRFVLEPLVEIASNLVHPAKGGTMEEWLKKMKGGGTVVKKGLFYEI